MNLQNTFNSPNLFLVTLFLYTRIIFCVLMYRTQYKILVYVILKYANISSPIYKKIKFIKKGLLLSGLLSVFPISSL